MPEPAFRVAQTLLEHRIGEQIAERFRKAAGSLTPWNARASPAADTLSGGGHATG
jgi:hypothetical protein